MCRWLLGLLSTAAFSPYFCVKLNKTLELLFISVTMVNHIIGAPLMMIFHPSHTRYENPGHLFSKYKLYHFWVRLRGCEICSESEFPVDIALDCDLQVRQW